MSHQSVCDIPCCLRPEPGGSAFETGMYRGHLWVHSRYGPVTCLPSKRWLCQSASSASFPTGRPPERLAASTRRQLSLAGSSRARTVLLVGSPTDPGRSSTEGLNHQLRCRRSSRTEQKQPTRRFTFLIFSTTKQRIPWVTGGNLVKVLETGRPIFLLLSIGEVVQRFFSMIPLRDFCGTYDSLTH